MVFALLLAALTSRAAWINEVLFNPPGTNNIPDQYIELRGPANLTLTNTYFVAVEGDSNGNPGTIQNVFDLDGQRIGGNGFLVLLQNSNSYVVNPGATTLVNTNGAGFGSGSSSTIKHHGKNGQVGLEPASVTFFLIETTIAPDIGNDIDANDDGVPDGAAFASWNVLDSVGVLDNDGTGDIAYGKINFRRANDPGHKATAASGVLVPLEFTPGYIGRVKNSKEWSAADWVAGDNLVGVPPRWKLSRDATSFAKLVNKPLNHLGAPNFGGARLPGVIVRVPADGLEITEGAPARSYSLALSLKCARGLMIQIDAPAGTEVSIDRGRSYRTNVILKLAGVSPRTVLVRLPKNDDVVGIPTRKAKMTHTIVSSGDAVNYPIDGTIIPPATLRVNDDERVVMSEIKANPPGPEDAPFEFIELRGTPGALLTHLSFVALEGNTELNPGIATAVIDLNGLRIGANGLVMIVAPNTPYVALPGTTVCYASQLSRAGGGLGNGAVTFLLVSTTNQIVEGADLDAGDNGQAEGLPLDAVIADSLAWLDGDGGDEVYTKAVLEPPSGKPDAATRFSTNNTPNSALAWFGGRLDGTNAESLTYDPEHVTANFPLGTAMSPGVTNNTAPQVSALPPFTSTIGDPTTPAIHFTISDAESPVNALHVSVRSTNALVVPDQKLFLSGSGAQRTLKIEPIGVGYSRIIITVSDGAQSSERAFDFGASVDERGNGRFHSGASDASTAYAIDARWMIAGDDERQVLRLYSRSNSDPAVATFDMNLFLGLTDLYDDGTPKEIDIEASTHVGKRIYWLGSHSHTGDLLIATNRARLFATDISGTGTNVALTYVGRYDYLKIDLLYWDSLGEHGKGVSYYGFVDSSQEGVNAKSPDGSGFNIEGLTMAPNSSNVAYVGFRAPLIPPANRVKALIVPVTNFAALAISGGEPGRARFGAPIELNLGGRSIRSIESVGTNYLIVAGPPGPASNAPPKDFKLFTWTGRAEDQPQQRAADLTGLNPEAIVDLPKLPWTSNSRVQLLSDNGTTLYYGDDIQAKHLHPRELKKARTDWVTLGAVVPQSPLLRVPTQSNASLTLTWYSVADVRYRIQTTDSFGGAWTDLPGDVVADDATASKEVYPSDTQRFFRVIAVP